MEYFGDNAYLAGLDEDYWKFENKRLRHNCYKVKRYESYTKLHKCRYGKHIRYWDRGYVNYLSSGYYLGLGVLPLPLPILKIHEYCRYKRNLLNGKYLLYYDNGDIHAKNYYIDNKLHGKCIVFNVDGTILKEEIYQNGMPIQINKKQIIYTN